MKTILVDVDDVICTNHFLPVMNLLLNKNYKEEDFKTTEIEQELFPTLEEREKFNDFFPTVDSYSMVELKEGAYEVLERLFQKHRVILLTNGHHYEREVEFSRQFTDKLKFILTKLPFIPSENIIFAAQKDLFIADIIIDDRAKNMTGKYATKLLYTVFHNKDIPNEELEKQNIIRVHNWYEIEKIIDALDNEK